MESLRKEKTKTLLCDALIELLSEKDFEEIKLKEICDKAMVHKTTFYNHFSDKYDLLYFTVRNVQVNVQMNINESDPFKYYLNLAKLYIKNIKENPKFYGKILTTNSNGYFLDIFCQIYIDEVKDKIEKNKADIVPSNYMAKFYVTGIVSVVTEWFIKGMKESEDELIKYIEKLTKK